MDTKGMILTIVWSLVIMIGIGTNYFVAERITTGEFYICLMIWLYVTDWFLERSGDDKWKK